MTQEGAAHGAPRPEAANDHAASVACRNCGTPAPLKYCPNCGQETSLHPLSVWEFFHEIVSHYIALEGKLWRTLALLALRPGRLTREFLAGRRARYIVPLRLYLTASFLFFVGSQWLVPTETHDAAEKKAAQEATAAILDGRLPGHPAAQPSAPGTRPAPAPRGAAQAPPPDRAGDAAAQAQEDDDEKAVIDFTRGMSRDKIAKWEQCAEAGNDCDWLRRAIAPGMLRLKKDPELFKERFFERFRHSVSYAMFAVLPIFALLLALVYRRRSMYYGEHLIFALHLHSFWFLASFLFLLMPAVIQAGLPLYFVGYGFWAMQRVYGGRWWATGLRGAFLCVVYGLVVGLGTAGLTLALLAT